MFSKRKKTVSFSNFYGFLHLLPGTFVQGLFVPSYSIMKVKTKDNKVVIFSFRKFLALVRPIVYKHRCSNCNYKVCFPKFLSSILLDMLLWRERRLYIIWLGRVAFLAFFLFGELECFNIQFDIKSIFLPRKSLHLIYELSISPYLFSPD